MQKTDILTFIKRVDLYLRAKAPPEPNQKKFELKIFGKSALMIAGINDSVGTKDIDILKMEAAADFKENQKTISILEEEFGQHKHLVHGYYLEFVSQAMVFLSQQPKWIPLESHECVSVTYLDPHHVIASKLFSAFSQVNRKQDKQDIREALDQGLVSFQEICKIADSIFDFHFGDSRADRFPKVYRYIKELMLDYGDVQLRYLPDDDDEI